MGGGPGTPELAAAVSNSGCLGSLACAYLTPGQIKEEFSRTRALTSGPLNLNLFAGGYHESTSQDSAPILELLMPIHAALRLPPPTLPMVSPDPFRVQLSTIIDLHPEVLSFTFGVPDADMMLALRAARITTVGTATTLREAELLSDAGVDAIVAQGAEAGAHRGTFATDWSDGLVRTLDLVRQIRGAVPEPVIAAGGIMTGAAIATALGAGAEAVQLGTAFLTTPEAGTSLAYRDALRKSSGEDTVVTRAFSGRAARGIRNRFIDLVAERQELILPFPIQNSLTRAMRIESAKARNPDYLSLWAGTGVAEIRDLPAAELIATLLEELRTGRGTSVGSLRREENIERREQVG